MADYSPSGVYLGKKRPTGKALSGTPEINKNTRNATHIKTNLLLILRVKRKVCPQHHLLCVDHPLDCLRLGLLFHRFVVVVHLDRELQYIQRGEREAGAYSC